MRSNPPPYRAEWTHVEAKRRPVDVRGLTARGAEMMRLIAAERDAKYTACDVETEGMPMALPGEVPTCPTCAGHLAAAFWVERLADARRLG